MIVANGITKSEKWAKGLVKNFARPPAGGDTDLLKATAAGQCNIALANTYYLGRMINSKSEQTRKIAENLVVFWPNQGDKDRGAHITSVEQALPNIQKMSSMEKLCLNT